MKFSVGYQANPEWIDAILSNRAAIHDCYFSFGAMPSGRRGVCDPLRQLDDLGRLADGGIGACPLIRQCRRCLRTVQALRSAGVSR